jgi:hypothetical protein
MILTLPTPSLASPRERRKPFAEPLRHGTRQKP